MAGTSEAREPPPAPEAPEANDLAAKLAEAEAGAPTPQAVVDLLGHSLNLAVCAILLRRRSVSTSVANYIANEQLRAALARAYTDEALNIDIFQQVGGGREPVPAEVWIESARVPAYLADLLRPDQWLLSLDLRRGDELIGFCWLLGGGPGAARAPDPPLLEAIARLATKALSETLGIDQAKPLRSEISLLEELSGTLIGRARLQDRLEAVVERAQRATGFASVEFLTPDPAEPERLIHALFVQNMGFVRRRSPPSSAELDFDRQLFSRRPGPLLLPDPARLDLVNDIQRRWMIDNGITFLAIIPLLYGDEYLGTIRICSAFSEDRTWERLRVFTALGTNISAMLKNALLLVQVEEAHARLTIRHHGTVRMLAQAAEARDPFTGNHLRHIEQYARALAAALDFSPADVESTAFGAIVHDVGKLRIPDAILLKPGRLSAEEWAALKLHPLYGEEILAPSEIPTLTLQIVRWHHERWDGRGYPDGLSGEDIPLGVQAVALADVFDALTSDRPYKRAWAPDRARNEIIAKRRRQFAPAVVDAFDSLWRAGAIEAILTNHACEPSEGTRAA
jgi:HD-GYP domain-containing protein (c-di-GMP phosphodiesterase class II)